MANYAKSLVSMATENSEILSLEQNSIYNSKVMNMFVSYKVLYCEF